MIERLPGACVSATRATIVSVLLFAAFCGHALAGSAAAGPNDALLVFAAASLTDALETLGAQYTARTRRPVKFSFAASSTLARQIEAGTRADVFFSADHEWMDYLEQRGLIAPRTRRDIIANRLVLIAPADSRIELRIARGFAIADALGRGRLATGDPDTVPVGRYARTALTSLGVWNEVAPRLARADNVRSALAFVARGETPLGIVYETDALIEKRVRLVDVFPANTHPPIRYPAAATRYAVPAGEFVEFLQSRAAQEIFRRYGFRPVSAPPDSHSDRDRAI